MDPGILVILTEEATLARVVRSPHSVIPLPAPGQPGQPAQSPYTRAVREWFSGLVGTHSRATGQQLTPAGNPPIVIVINMACIRV